MCGVSACENMQKRVSHGETVRVGSSALLNRLLYFLSQVVAERLFYCVCVFQMWVKLLCVLPYQIMPFISVLRMFQHFDSLFTLPRVKALSMCLIALSLTWLRNYN